METARIFCCASFSGSLWDSPHDGRMNLDYRKLRRPQFIFISLFGVLVLLAAFSFSINRTGRIAGFNWARQTCSPPNSPSSLDFLSGVVLEGAGARKDLA